MKNNNDSKLPGAEFRSTSARRGEPQCPPFLTRKWSDILMDVYGMEPFFLESGNDSLSILLVKSRIFGNRLISVPFADYGGICGEGKNASALLEDVIKLADNLNINFMEIRTPSPAHFKLFGKNGFERRDDYVTFLMDLEKKEGDIFGGLEKRVRNDVNKSSKFGILFRDGKNENDVKTFYHVYLKNMKRIGSPPQSLKFFSGLWKKFSQKNLCIRLAEFEGKVLACCLFFLSGKTVNYSYSCSLAENRNVRASDGLLWDSIKRFKERGFTRFDFGRTRPDSGVYFYKLGWGGEKVTMPYFYRFYKKRAEQRQEIAYQRYSEIWRKYMPETLAKRLGPWIIKQIG